MRDLAIKVLTFGAIAYFLIGSVAYWGQHFLIYPRDSTRTDPERLGLAGVREQLLPTSDGETIVVWRANAAPGQPTILYFHGNGGALANRAYRIGFFRERGFGLAMMSYRGYSGSSGRPSEQANYRDAAQVLAELERAGTKRRDIFVYGESLGTGVAVEIAATHAGLGGLILEAPYTTLGDAAAARFGFLPVRTFIAESYASIDKIGRVGAPLLIVHGAKDWTIPITLGERLFAAARGPKLFRRYEGRGHNDLYVAPNSAFVAVDDFVTRVRDGRPLD